MKEVGCAGGIGGSGVGAAEEEDERNIHVWGELIKEGEGMSFEMRGRWGRRLNALP